MLLNRANIFVKTTLLKTLFFAFAIALMPLITFAQKDGDFRSAGTGKWSNKGAGADSSKSIWEQYHAAYSTDWKIAFDADLGADTVAMRSPGYDAGKWVPATVPGTVLTAYVNAGLVPDPTYADNITKIDFEKFRRNVWFRTEFTVPKGYAGKHIWLNFDGLNKKSNIYINNVHIGNQVGMMIRGRYDITKLVNASGNNVIAILIYSMTNNFNNLEMPSYLPSAGWDWMPPVPGLNRGITGKVYLSTSDQVTIADPYMRTMALGNNNTQATLDFSTQLVNHSDTAQNGTLSVIINPGNIKLNANIALAPKQTKTYDPGNFVMNNPKLWWPNGSGDPNLYNCKLIYIINGKVSDSTNFNFGVRKYGYINDKNGALQILVNGKHVLVRGGCWGLSEYMLRSHGKDYDTRIRFHKEMNMNMIRAWAGTETDDDFYNYCDKYGIMLWDEFWLNNFYTPMYDEAAYYRNVSEKVKRERNHASVAVWCGDNENISYQDVGVEDSIKKYDMGQRLYQSSSNQKNPKDNSQFGLIGQGGLSGDGGYSNLDLTSYFTITHANTTATVGNYGFHSEFGAACFPTTESFKMFMPEANLWPRNDLWNTPHYFSDDFGFGGGASPSNYMNIVNNRYGTASGIEDFCRKAQLVNIETHKAMFEGYNDHIFNDATGMMMWMSQSAFPTMIWQTYDYYFDCTGAYWGIKTALQPVHIQWNCATDAVKVINTTHEAANNLTATIDVYNLDGTLAQGYSNTATVNALPDTSGYIFNAINNNLALNKPAVSSSDQNATLLAVNAFDGSLADRWNSAFSANEWIYVDLGSPQTVGYVILSWSSAYAKSYKVQVSNDAQNWTDAYSSITGKGSVETLTFPTVTGRYVRMLGIVPATQFGYSLKEIQIYSQPPAALSDTHFIKLQLKDASGKVVSDNFYWRSVKNVYTALNTMAVIPLTQSTTVATLPNGNKQITLTLNNAADSQGIAFDIHVQLLQADGSRVLPVFMNNNYFSLIKGESKAVTIEFDPNLIKGGLPKLLIEQYNSRIPPVN